MILHAIARAPSVHDVLPEYETRCGLVSLRLPDGRFDKFSVARDEPSVTCPRCRIKITPVQEKVLRLMLAHERPVVLGPGRFQFARERSRMWAPANVLEGLKRYALVRCTDGATLHELSVKGRVFARSLPKIAEEEELW